MQHPQHQDALQNAMCHRSRYYLGWLRLAIGRQTVLIALLPILGNLSNTFGEEFVTTIRNELAKSLTRVALYGRIMSEW